jgi:RimJ/RimL family protein N-acetyltransferase
VFHIFTVHTIDNIWITPAFQGKKRAHEAVLLVLQWLHASGTRAFHICFANLSFI